MKEIEMTQVQEKEFREVLEGLKDYRDLLPSLKGVPSAVTSHGALLAGLRADLDQVRRINLSSGGQRQLAPGQVVTNDCAEYLAAIVVAGAEQQGKLQNWEPARREALLEKTRAILRVEQRASLTTSDIPLPVGYGSQIVELVWKYGAARKYGTVYPLGSGTVHLPRLKTSPAFGLILMAAPVTEKSPQMEFVEFEAQKWGGLIRVPAEIEADAVAGFGQWLAEYCARELARLEDTVFWVADGTATYASLKGVTKAALDLGYVLTLAGGKTHPSDLTLQNFRDLRTKVASAAHANAAYYVSRTMESLLTCFNGGSAGTPYVLDVVNGEPRLDGYPIRWVDTLPLYDTANHAGQLQVVFGDARFMYLGARPGLSIAISRDVFFTTDEIAVRALERFTTGLMADAALAVLQLAES